MTRPYWLRKRYLRRHWENAILRPLGWTDVHWTRIVQYRACFEVVRQLGPENLDVLEISAGHLWRENFTFRSFRGTQYPDYDLEGDPFPELFDLVIADHVLLHLDDPMRGVANMKAMLRPRGVCIVTTPFLIKANLPPQDCLRWTERGLANLMASGGFSRSEITTGSWGNRACVISNFRRWTPYGFGFFKSLRNEPDFPVSVWAIART